MIFYLFGQKIDLKRKIKLNFILKNYEKIQGNLNFIEIIKILNVLSIKFKPEKSI